MAEGNTWHEDENDCWICKEIHSEKDLLIVMKVNRITGEIRYDRYIPNFKYNKEHGIIEDKKEEHSHEWNSSTSKYGEHPKEISSKIKSKLY